METACNNTVVTASLCLRSQTAGNAAMACNKTACIRHLTTQKDISTASMVDVYSILSTSHLRCDKRIYKWTPDQILIHIWTPSWSCNHLNVQLKTQLGVVQLQPVCVPTQHLPIELELLRLLGGLLPCLGFCAQHCRQAHTDIMGC